MKVEFEFPLRTISRANSTEHWSKRHRRVKEEHKIVWAAWLQNVRQKIPIPCVVTLTRIAPRSLDTDNLTSSMKAGRDCCAKMLGIDDRDSRVEWRYKQEKGEPKFYGVRIEIRWEETDKNWKDGKGR